jgi:hypothetical protein
MPICSFFRPQDSEDGPGHGFIECADPDLLVAQL